MESDALVHGVPLPMLVAVGVALLGGMAGLLRWFAVRLLGDIDERLDAHARDVARIDEAMQRLIADLPIHYQRREDAVREIAALHAKLDRIYELVIALRRE